MPAPSVIAAAKARLAAAGITGPRLMPQVFAAENDQSGTQEDRRRRSETPAVTTASIPALGGSIPPASTPAVTTTPVTAAVIDRQHKESGGIYGGYVTVHPPHDSSETDQTPPLNPGYATTLNAAYQKALVMAALIKDRDARVCIRVLGGKYIEDLSVTSDRIDIIGLSPFQYYGNIIFQPTATKSRLENCEAIQPPVGPAIFVTPLLPNPAVEMYTEFVNCKMHGPGNVFFAQRPVYLERCHSWLDALPVGEVAPLYFNAGEYDVKFSEAFNCRFEAFKSFVTTFSMDPASAITTQITVPPPGVQQYNGFAIIATGKILGAWRPPLPTTNAYGGVSYIRWNSGLVLSHSRVNGGLVCEGWMVKHDQCYCSIGQQAVGTPGFGNSYAIIRGKEFSVEAGTPFDLSGYVFWDRSTVRARYVATFDSDPTDTLPYTWSGAAFFRGSGHLAFSTGGIVELGAGGAAFTQTGTAGGWTVYTDGQSSTGCAAWPAVDTAGCNVPWPALFDPFDP